MDKVSGYLRHFAAVMAGLTGMRAEFSPPWPDDDGVRHQMDTWLAVARQELGAPMNWVAMEFDTLIKVEEAYNGSELELNVWVTAAKMAEMAGQ